MKVQGARPFMGFVYELVHVLFGWLVPPCVHCTALGHNCFVCAERVRSAQHKGDDSNKETGR